LKKASAGGMTRGRLQICLHDMKRLLYLDVIRRHKVATAVLAITVAALSGFCLIRRPNDSQARYLKAVAARHSAQSLLADKQLGESERSCRIATKILNELAARSSDPRIRVEQAAALETLALIQTAALHPDEADALYRAAIDIWARLLADDQTAALVRSRLARCLSRRAPLLIDKGLWEEAEKNLERGSIVCRTRIGIGPSDIRVDRELSTIRNQLGLTYLHTGSFELARANYDDAVKLQKALVESPDSIEGDVELLVTLLINQARAHAAAKHDEAPGEFAKARELAERLGTAPGSTARCRDLVASLLESEAAKLARDPRTAVESRILLERAESIRESLIAGAPVEPEFLDRLGQTCGLLAEAFQTAHSDGKAEEYLRKELSYQSRLSKDYPGLNAYRFGRGRALHNLAEFLRQRGKGPEALTIEREAAPLLAEVYRENVLDNDHRRAVSYAYWTLCTLELDRRAHAAAAQAVAAYQSIEPNGYEEAHAAAGFLCRCIALCQNDQSLTAAEKERVTTSYTDLAMTAFETAVREGFRDLNELKTSRIYDPLRGRPEFARMIHDVELFDEAYKEG